MRKSQITAERWTVNLSQTEEKEDTKDDDLPYVFSSNKLPVQTHVFYQLCDLHIAEVQEIITANDGQVSFHNKFP